MNVTSRYYFYSTSRYYRLATIETRSIFKLGGVNTISLVSANMLIEDKQKFDSFAKLVCFFLVERCEVIGIATFLPDLAENPDIPVGNAIFYCSVCSNFRFLSLLQDAANS